MFTSLFEKEKIVESFLNLDESSALQISTRLLEDGIDPVEVLESCRRAMTIVGERFEKGDIFLSEMIMAAEIFKGVMNIIKPRLKRSVTEDIGRVLIGTVEGDVHDIGKNIVIALLEVEGFEVVDLGVDVPPERFVEAIVEYAPDIVGLSGLLTVAIESIKKTIDAIDEAGLRDKVKIIIGGGRIDEYASDYIKPDAFTDNAAKGVRMCKELIGSTET